MLTPIAVLITGIYFIIVSQQHVSTTLTLIIGIVVAVLALVDLARAHGVLR